MTDPDRPESVRDVDYKGAPLDSEKGPGLGCFWAQLVVLGVLLILTPLSVAWNWPFWISGGLLIVVLLLLLLAGQTVIFLLRLVAADRRAAGRRRPLGSSTPTVGEIEDRGPAPAADPGEGLAGPADVSELMRFETDPEVDQIAQAYAADLVDLGRSQYSLDLDFTVRSIADVDRIAANIVDTKPRMSLRASEFDAKEDSFAKMLGFYVAETIRLSAGAEHGWVHTPAGQRFYGLRLADGALCWPVGRAQGRLRGDQSGDFVSYVHLLLMPPASADPDSRP